MKTVPYTLETYDRHGSRSGGKPIFKPSPWGLLPPVFSAPSYIFVA